MRERNIGEENIHNRKEWKRLIDCPTPLGIKGMLNEDDDGDDYVLSVLE